MKILSPYDRIALVEFDSRSNVIFPLKRNTPENKDFLK